MTKQEAEVCVKRLERVWGGAGKVIGRLVRLPSSGGKRKKIYCPQLQVVLAPKTASVPVVRFNCKSQLVTGAPRLSIDAWIRHVWMASLICDFEVGEIPSGGKFDTRTPSEKAKIKGVETQWHLLFRRNCWLSGCPVEASAHEKMEWMQDFSREELETWNLKF